MSPMKLVYAKSKNGLATIFAGYTRAADTLIATTGPWTWTDNCSEQMKVTLRIYAIAGTPIAYRWDYQIDNILIASNYGDSYVNGIGVIGLSFSSNLSDLTNAYASTNWGASAFTESSGIPQCGSLRIAGTMAIRVTMRRIYSVGPGQTMHFGFTTNRCLPLTLSACAADPNSGLLVEISCVQAERSEVLGFGFIDAGRFSSTTRAATARLLAARSTELKPRDFTVCSEQVTGQIVVPGDAFRAFSQLP